MSAGRQTKAKQHKAPLEQDSAAQTPKTAKYWVDDIVESLGKIKAESSPLPEDARGSLREYSPNFVKIAVKDIYRSLSNIGHKSSTFPSVLLLGPPGVGKSTLVREVARELAGEDNALFFDITKKETQEILLELLEKCVQNTGDPEKCTSQVARELSNGSKDNIFVYLDLRLTEVEPQDLLGLPSKDESGKHMTYLPPAWARILSYVPGILFLDEISNIDRPDVLAAAYKIFLDRSAGFLRFNPKVLVVAAGNLPSHAPELARPLPAPLVNRSTVIYVGSPSVDEWYEWTKREIEKITEHLAAASQDLREMVLSDHMRMLSLVESVLRFDKTLLKGWTASRNIEINENFPTPRAWTHLVITTPFSKIERLLKMPNGENLVFNYVARYVGSQAASTLLTLLKTSMSINTEDLLDSPDEELRRLLEEPPPEEAAHDEKTDNMFKLLVATFGLASQLPAINMPLDEKIEKTARFVEALIRLGNEQVGEKTGVTLARSFEKHVFESYRGFRARNPDSKQLPRILMEQNKIVTAIRNKIKEAEGEHGG